MKPGPRALVLGSALVLVAAAPAAAQRLLEWPVRTRAGAHALAPAAEAAFWNPAAAGLIDSTADAMLLDVNGPDLVGIGGLAVSGAVRVRPLTTVFAGYNHLGVYDIARTSTTPMEDEGSGAIDVSEDVFSLGAAHELADRLLAGATLRYWRSTVDGERESGAALGAGVVYRPSLPFRSSVAAAVFGGDADPGWMLGVEATAPPWAENGWRVGMSYGLSGGEWPRRPAHHAALTGEWPDVMTLSVGLDVEPGVGAVSVGPVVAATLKLGRYTLGAVREQMLNGFGAAYYYRLHMRL